MKYKLVVFVPLESADKVREAIGSAGGGKIGNYSHCSWSTRGVGRFLPLDGANPAIGEVGKMEAVEEERIETVIEEQFLTSVISAMKKAHPYEEVAYDIYKLEDI